MYRSIHHGNFAWNCSLAAMLAAQLALTPGCDEVADEAALRDAETPEADESTLAALADGEVRRADTGTSIMPEPPAQAGVEVAPITEDAEPTSSASSKVVASVRLPDGGEVHFIDLGPPEAPGLATVYSTPSDVVGALMHEHRATPLEIFLALAPAEDSPPGLLFAHHERLASEGLAEASPRSLLVDDLVVPPSKALDWSGGLSNCVYSTTASYFSAMKELVDGDYGFEVGAHDQEFHAAVTNNTYVTLGSSTSGWLASCRKSKGADNNPDVNLRFDQYTGGAWSSFWDPALVDSTWGWVFAYHDTVNRQFRMAITTIDDDTAYAAARF